MNIKERIFRSLGYRLQNISTKFKSLDVINEFQGLKIRNRGSDIRVFKQIFLDQMYYFFPANLDPEIIIDAGANVGFSSLWFSKQFPKAKITAIEPEETNFNLLVDNIKYHEKITAIKAALWCDLTPLIIANKKADSWAFRTVKADINDDNQIQTVSILSVIKNYNLKGIDILKIDIEGAEYELFETNAEVWLPFVKMLMIEVHDNIRPGCSELIDKVVFPFGFLKFVTSELTIYIKQ